MRLVTFGQDLLKILTVITAIAQVSEPVVDMSVPGIAQVYNLSANEGAQLIQAFLGAGSSSSAPAAASVAAPAVVPAALPAPVEPAVTVAESVSDPAPAEPASEVVSPGPGLHNVVPA